MRSNAPGLLPVLRSPHLAEMLTLLLLHPAAEYTLTELAGKLDLPLTTVQREVNRLSGSGLIRERRIGRSRLVSADPASRYTRPLTELLSIAFGPLFVIDEEFQAIGALAVAIYGSWAARYQGITGPPPNDVDVLVIGDVARRDMYEAAERAEQRLGLPVNPVLCSRDRWLAAADPLIQQIRMAPLTWVTGQEPRLGGRLMRRSTAAAEVERLLASGHIERVQARKQTARPGLTKRGAASTQRGSSRAMRLIAASSSPMTQPGSALRFMLQWGKRRHRKMNLDAVVSKGRLPWQPSADASDLVIWHQYEHPLSGTFSAKSVTVLFAAVDGVESDVSVWAYACLEHDEARELADVAFESREDLRHFIDVTLASHRLVLALANDLVITDWSVADRIGPVYEVAADFLEQVLAERLKFKDPRARVHEQLAWVSASVPQHVGA